MGTNGKTFYIAYMCDHSYVLAAALEAFGMAAEVMPVPDDETMNLGLDSMLGRECSPCFMTTGDMIRRARQPDFDPKKAIMLMPTANGPCRFGQYNVLQRRILDDYGLQDVEFFSSSAGDSYQGLGDHPNQMRLLVWDGAVATDLLQKLLHAYRPYEVNKGQTDGIYKEGLQQIITAIRAGGGNALSQALDHIARQFEALPVDRSEPRPIIGLVGEIYLRFCPYANQDIIRQVEEAGGEVVLASMIEWFYFTNWSYMEETRDVGQYFKYLTTAFTDMYQWYREHKFARRVAHLLKHPYEAPIKDLMNNIRPYYDPALSTEAVLTLGKAIELAKHGASGILNIMPFTCMPGIIVAGLAPRVRADLANIPWLDVIFDAQAGTNFHTRLEAFMYQSTQYYRRVIVNN